MKKWILAVMLFLIMFLVAMLVNVNAQTYLYSEWNYMESAWIKTATNDWYYEGGPKFGIGYEIKNEKEFKWYLQTAINILAEDPKYRDFNRYIKIAPIGQSIKTGIYINRDVKLNLDYELNLWYVDTPAFGDDIFLNRSKPEHKFSVKMRVDL